MKTAVEGSEEKRYDNFKDLFQDFINEVIRYVF